MNCRVQNYVEQVSQHYVSQYDVYSNKALEEFPLDFLALYKRVDEKYVMTKKIKVWSVENQQCVFVTTCPTSLTLAFIHDYMQRILEHMPNYIPAKPEHMSTTAIGVIVTPYAVDEPVRKAVCKYRKLRFLKYGWHGWAEIYVGIAGLQDQKLLIHPKGERFIQPFVQWNSS